MAFKLRENEEIKMTAKFHWSDYLVSGTWALLCTPALIVSIFSKDVSMPSPFMFFLIGYMPLIYKILKNRSKKFHITNQRLYIEKGILTKTSADVPLNKINDITFSQNFIERIFNVGNLQILTGNDKGNIIQGICEPELFRECLSKYSNLKAS